MCHWKKWIWPGILTIAILSALALWMKADFIEKDLTAKANQVLAESGQTWAKVEMDGRDATIVGLAPSEASQAEAEFVIDDPVEVYDVRVVANKSQLMAAQSPYVLTAIRTGDKVELTGFTPDESTRATVLSSAKEALQGIEIVDKMELARGAPEGYAAMAGFGFTQLAGLNTGEMSLENEKLSLKGAAADRDSFDGINSALASSELPGGAKLALKEVTAPSASPYIWNADYDGEKIKLAGFVPSEEARQSVIASAKSALPNAEIIDEQKLAIGQPDGFTDAAGFALQQLPRFTSGNVGLSGLDLSVAGVADSTANYTTALDSVGAALPAGVVLANSDIKPATISPYTWGAEYNGEKITLSGYVPDSETRQSIVGKAGDVLGGAEIVDTMQIAAGAPNGFSSGTDFALEQLPSFSSGMVGLSGLDLTVKGVSKDSASYQSANAAVASALPANMNLADKQIVPATITPYTWSADYDGTSVVLSGFVPDSGVRAAIKDAVKGALPEASIEDKMAIAAGAPASFAGATAFGVEQLKRFSSGSSSLSDLGLSVKGVALDSATYVESKSVLSGALPSDMKLASEEIVPATVSPYQWNADYTADAVTLGGYVPNDEVRGSILSAVKKALPNAKVTDGMQIANGAPEGFVNAARFSSNQLTRFSSGSVALSDRALAVRGVALDSSKYTAAKAAVDGGLPADMTLASENIVPPSVSPYTWSADYMGDTVTLNGFVPDTKTREGLVAEAKSRLPAAKIVDNMQIAAGAPSDFENASKGAIAVLPRFSNGDVALSDLDLTVNGVAKTSSDYPTAKSYVEGALPGGTILAQANIVPPAADGAYVWTARKTGNEITVSGMVPNEKAKSAIARGAQSLNPGASIIDEQEIVSGAPKGFLSNTRNGLGLLNKLKSGTVNISDDTVGVVGFSNSVNDHEMAITQAAKTPVAGAKWVQRDITPPTIKPFTWAIVKGAEKAELSGFVPNRGMGNTNVAATQAVLEKEVDDKQRVGGGAPAEFGNAVAALVSGVDRLDNSRGSITGENVFIQGRTSSEAEADKIRTEIAASLPGNYKFRDQISYPLPKVAPKPKPKPVPKPKPKPVVETKPAVCEVDFAGIFGDEKILFDTARAVIKEESNGLLNKLADGLKKCPNAKVEIGGHTDSRGSSSYNQGLSEARAQSVVAYMIKSGASAQNLVAKGYGEANPIASNNLPADRAKNRRIEFKVISAE